MINHDSLEFWLIVTLDYNLTSIGNVIKLEHVLVCKIHGPENAIEHQQESLSLPTTAQPTINQSGTVEIKLGISLSIVTQHLISFIV